MNDVTIDKIFKYRSSIPNDWPIDFKLSKNFDCGQFQTKDGIFEVLPYDDKKRECQANITSYKFIVGGARHYFACIEIHHSKQIKVIKSFNTKWYKTGEIRNAPPIAPNRYMGHGINLCVEITEEFLKLHPKLTKERYRIGDICSQFMTLTEALDAVVDFYHQHFDSNEWILLDSWQSSLAELRELSPGAYERLKKEFQKP